MLFRRAKALPADAHRGINAFIIYLALPAVSFKYLPYIYWGTNLLLPALTPIVVWLGGWLCMMLFARSNKSPKPTTGGLKLTAGLSNTSFIGFPLIAAYYGEKYIGIGVICDQVTFFLLSTIGVVVAVGASDSHALSARLIVKKVLLFPPFLGCVAALTIPHFVDIKPLAPFFDKMAGTVGPLALFSVGLQIKFKGWLGQLKYISAAVLYKLMIAPALVLLIALALGQRGITTQVSILEASMPTLLTAGVVADEYHNDPDLSNLIIGISIVLCFITTIFWWKLPSLLLAN